MMEWTKENKIRALDMLQQAAWLVDSLYQLGTLEQKSLSHKWFNDFHKYGFCDPKECLCQKPKTISRPAGVK